MANRGLLPSPLSRGGATGAGHPPEGEREGEPLTGARAGSARARAGNAGERSPWAARPVSAGHLP